MALCLECKADYLPHFTVCPACGRALEPEERAVVPPAAEGFVPFLTTGYPEGMAAAASLEAAGLETRLTTMDYHIYLATPLYVTVLVRERDVEAASVALRRPPPPPAPPPQEPPRCVVCGAAATVHETERQAGVISTTDYCPDHVREQIPPGPSDAPSCADEDVAETVAVLNGRKDVRTVCSCSGSHPGAGDGFVSLAPAGEDAASADRFDAFVKLLQERVASSDVAGRVKVDWSAVHGAEINLASRDGAKDTWAALAHLLASLP